MAKFTTKARKALPKAAFGLPGKRAYPLPDASHAQNAKARATQQVNAGKLAPSTAAKIKAKANVVLDKGAAPGGDKMSTPAWMKAERKRMQAKGK